MQSIGKLSEGILLTNTECVNILCKKTYITAPRQHKEPRNISWQWSVRKEPGDSKCKDLCVPKACPKKRFLPRFKKSYIPAEKKACVPVKRKQSWTEYFSYLLPDPVPKPPLITCRKLQAQRRECCGNPMDCGAYCLRDNCCPPPKEWYGQAVIYDIPSNFPEPVIPDEPKPCAPPPPTEPPCNLVLKGICPQPKQELNMDDYAYRRAFSGINACLESKSQPQFFKCVGKRVEVAHEVNKREKLTCGLSSPFKESTCSISTSNKDTQQELPPLVCKTKQEKKPKELDVAVEGKKGVCGRTSFLKPYKQGEKYPGMENCRSFHTLRNSFSDSIVISKCNYSAGSYNQVTISDPSPKALAESNWLNYETPAFVTRPSYYQPSHSGMSLQAVLTRQLAGLWKEGGMYVPPEHRAYRFSVSGESHDNHDVPDIDPELLALAEETRKKTKPVGPAPEENSKEPPPITLARRLSNEVTQRMIKRAKDGLEENSPTRHVPVPAGRTKLSLLKKSRSPLDFARASFTTDTTSLASKKDKGTSKKKTICSGCSGIRQAEEEEKNPPPKSFLDCKVRPAGKCRGPTRKLLPGDKEPNNPYYRNKAKPFSLCNKPRPIIKKEERPYKMPCEENQKRKFHTSSLTSASTPAFTTLCEIVKSKGITLNDKGPNTKVNAWDSHTPDSYQEKDTKGYDSVPDLRKFEDAKPLHRKDSFSSISIRSKKSSLSQINPSSILKLHDSSSERVFMSPSESNNDWGSPRDYESNHAEISNVEESAKSKPEEEQKKTRIKMDKSAVNIWGSGNDLNSTKDTNQETNLDNSQESIVINERFFKGTKDSGPKASETWPSSNFSKSFSKPKNIQTRFSAIFNSSGREKQKIKDFD